MLNKKITGMKKFTLMLVLMFVGLAASAQETFSRKDNILSVGVGFGYHPAIDAKWEINVLDGLCGGKAGIGVGALWGTDFDDSMVLGAQSNFHVEFVDNLDTFVGLSLGGNFWDGHDNDGHLYWGIQVGTRYYFNDHWALMGEFGYGVSFAKIGFTYKF